MKTHHSEKNIPMTNLLQKFRGTLPAITLKYILASRYFPFFTAAVLLVCTYLALDIVMIYYMVAVIVLMLLLLDDLTPLLVLFAFFNVMASDRNSPSSLTGGGDFFTRPAVIAQIAVLGAIALCALVYRYVRIAQTRSFRPNALFWGMCALCATFLLSGAGAKDYTLMNLAYGAVMTFALVGIYVLFAANVKASEENFLKLGFGFFALSALLVIELFVRYMQILPEFRQFLSGALEYNRFKEYIYFGWGNWNTAGMLFSLCIPPVFLLAARYKNGWIHVVYATLLAACAVLTWSRQALIGVAVAYPAAAVAVLIKGKRRPLHAAVLCAFVLIVGVAALSRLDLIRGLIDGMSESIIGDEGEFTGNGRMNLIYAALDFFIGNPAFGSGFYMDLQDVVFSNITFMPVFACNTLAEVLGACGIAGILAYCVHRVQTVVAFARKPSTDAFLIGLALAALLVISLLDNHFFYILPTILYSGLLCFACKS